jgi:hypothetical protein
MGSSSSAAPAAADGVPAGTGHANQGGASGSGFGGNFGGPSTTYKAAAGAVGTSSNADDPVQSAYVAFDPDACEWYFIGSSNSSSSNDAAVSAIARAQQKDQQQQGKRQKRNQQQQHFVQGPALPPEQAFRVLSDAEVQQVFPGLCSSSDYSKLSDWILQQMESLTEAEVDVAIAEAQERIQGQEPEGLDAVVDEEDVSEGMGNVRDAAREAFNVAPQKVRSE